VGIDLVSVAEVRRALASFGERYLAHVFTAGERAYCTSLRDRSCEHLAARFAAKEATAKVLRLGDRPMSWRCIEVVRRSDGSCAIALNGPAVALALERGIRSLSVSLSHEGDFASAIVVGNRCLRPMSVSRFRRRPSGSYEK
jgi:holo-[acyl-carrier protein] synthase